jgi:hypothetical protein
MSEPKLEWEELPKELAEWLRKHKQPITLYKNENGEIVHVAGSMPYLLYEAFVENTTGYRDTGDYPLGKYQTDEDLLCYEINRYDPHTDTK